MKRVCSPRPRVVSFGQHHGVDLNLDFSFLLRDMTADNDFAYIFGSFLERTLIELGDPSGLYREVPRRIYASVF